MNKHKDHDYVTSLTLPEQIFNPDWAEVKDYAMQAAAFTMAGDLEKANDLYQHMAVEVMDTLYGPNAVATFIKYAMLHEPPNNESRIQLL